MNNKKAPDDDELDAVIKDHEFDKRLAEFKRERNEAIKGWTQWALTIILGALVLWDRIAEALHMGPHK